MTTNTKDWNSTALILRHRQALQVALPLGTALGRPNLAGATRAEVVVALGRMLIEAAGAASDAEVEDDA